MLICLIIYSRNCSIVLHSSICLPTISMVLIPCSLRPSLIAHCEIYSYQIACQGRIYQRNRDGRKHLPPLAYSALVYRALIAMPAAIDAPALLIYQNHRQHKYRCCCYSGQSYARQLRFQSGHFFFRDADACQYFISVCR